MKKLSEPIVFFGSGPVAAASLELLQEWAEVEAVVTKPRPPHHRGEVPVLELAERLRLPTYTVDSKAALDALFVRPDFTSRLAILVDFGIIVSQAVINYFPLGIVNSHFSLLPEWRGADPITFAILSGQKETGVSLMLVNNKMDEGPLLAQSAYDIAEGETTPQLTQNLIDLSNAMLKEMLPLYLTSQVTSQPQIQASIAASKEPTYSRKLSKNDGIIDWTKPAVQIEREIRAFIEWPKSHAHLGEVDVIITKAHAVPSDGELGEIEIIEDIGVLIVYCGEGYLCIDRLKPAGKKDMSTAEFIRGYGSKVGQKAL